MTDYSQLADQIKAWGSEAGFDALGITDCDLGAHAARLRRWLDEGRHGTMSYLARNVDKREHPERLLSGTVRILSARMDYLADAEQPLRVLEDPSRAYIARYALGRDYHKVVRRRLAKLAKRIDTAAVGFDTRYRAFTDSAPVLEKGLAEKAGLGWIGKNTLLLNRDAGSWFFLGEIFTNLPLPVDPVPEAGDCGSCSACINVCPTNAITAPGQLDARRCISYLTIESRDAIPVELRPMIGNRVFGCDDCQLWCPVNRTAQPTRVADFAPRHGLDCASLVDLFNWSEDEFLRRTEGSALRRVSYIQWSRNLAVGLGNGKATPEALAALQRRREDPSELVREHVAWALLQLTVE